ncbi:hypothetical protein ACFR9U_13825 [Halorientalis brevis]|uniref:Uncharacterized protein n=1 Tax=Halorientalis brevis TaxID=1126241 RepID=A0ABD6CCU7_9EURY
MGNDDSRTRSPTLIFWNHILAAVLSYSFYRLNPLSLSQSRKPEFTLLVYIGIVAIIWSILYFHSNGLTETDVDGTTTAETTDQDHFEINEDASWEFHTETAAYRRTITESRETLQNQINLANEIDDKAMRTTRTAVLILGIVISALGVTQGNPLDSVSIWTLFVAGFGVLILATSAVIGVGTYTVTNIPYGIGTNYRKDVLEGGYSEKEWLIELIRGYNQWSRDLSEQNDHNRDLLSRVQILLIFGISFLLFASGMRLFNSRFGIHPSVALLFLLVFVSDFLRLASPDLSPD